MATSRFNPHGDIFHDVHGHCLLSRVDGTWNMEMHAKSNALAAPLIAELTSQGPWGSVVVMTSTLVSGLDVLEHGRQLVIDSKDAMKLVSLAWVITPDIEGYRLLLGRYASLYEGVIPTAVFGDLQSALDWTEARVREAQQADNRT